MLIKISKNTEIIFFILTPVKNDIRTIYPVTLSVHDIRIAAQPVDHTLHRMRLGGAVCVCAHTSLTMDIAEDIVSEGIFVRHYHYKSSIFNSPIIPVLFLK